jgi:hypothetical protein
VKHETDAARVGVEAAVAVRRGGKQRGAYLQWLDKEIKEAQADVEYQGKSSDHLRLATLRYVRKAFTDEFYPK